jgi:hypothetical protein
MVDRPETRYDVALSFAGEQRSYVDRVAQLLRDMRIKVFYDDYEKTSLWGKDLYAHLDSVYRELSRYCVIFVSADYAAKVWTNHERQSAQARALRENMEYILPARFDSTALPGLRPTVGYLDLATISPDELAGLIKDKVGPRPVTPGFPTDLGRLHESVRKATGVRSTKQRKDEIRNVAYSLYDAMLRMTNEERLAVAGVLAFGCPGELPKFVHVSLDRLSRMIKIPPVQVVESLKAVRSLNVKASLRDPSYHPADDRELIGDDRDVTLSFWAERAPHAKDSTLIAYHAVKCAAHHFCADHGLSVVSRLDFHRLSSTDNGPIKGLDDVPNE